MFAEENKTVVRRFIEEVVNPGNEPRLFELVADDREIVGVMQSGRGPAVFMQGLGMLRTSFPDYHATIEELIAADDSVVVRMTEQGTHMGSFLGVATTGKQVKWSGINILRVVDRKIARSWGPRDRLDLLQQLGALPTPAKKTPNTA